MLSPMYKATTAASNTSHTQMGNPLQRRRFSGFWNSSFLFSVSSFIFNYHYLQRNTF